MINSAKTKGGIPNERVCDLVGYNKMTTDVMD
jgi:hypothetical protein